MKVIKFHLILVIQKGFYILFNSSVYSKLRKDVLPIYYSGWDTEIFNVSKRKSLMDLLYRDR